MGTPGAADKNQSPTLLQDHKSRANGQPSLSRHTGSGNNKFNEELSLCSFSEMLFLIVAFYEKAKNFTMMTRMKKISRKTIKNILILMPPCLECSNVMPPIDIKPYHDLYPSLQIREILKCMLVLYFCI